MPKILFTALAVIALVSSLCAGERSTVQFGRAEVTGFVVDDAVDRIGYCNTLSLDGVGANEYHVAFWQGSGDAAGFLKITAETAQQIAEEAEPFLLLAKRGRKFEEIASVDEDVEMKIKFSGVLVLEIAAAGVPHRFIYTGDKAALVIECLMDAATLSREWLDDSVCAAVQAGKPPRRAPGSRPDRPPGRLPAPDAGSAAAKDEAFAASEVALREMGIPGITEIQGRLTNNSGRDVSFGVLKLSFFDADDKLVGATDLMVHNFQAGETLTFTDMTDVDLTGWVRYDVRLSSGF